MEGRRWSWGMAAAPRDHGYTVTVRRRTGGVLAASSMPWLGCGGRCVAGDAGEQGSDGGYGVTLRRGADRGTFRFFAALAVVPVGVLRPALRWRSLSR